MTTLKPLLALRSALFFAGMPVIVVVFCLLGLLLYPLPYRIRARAMVAGNTVIVTWLRLTCGVRYRVLGTLPPAPFVALSKHQSQWETFFLQRFLFPVNIVLKRELLNVPFFGWALRLLESVAIDRGSPKEAMRQTMREGTKRLQAGRNMLIFPEGTRTAPGQRGRYARGGAGLAIAAGVPVLPIAHNAGDCWPARSMLIRPGIITVVVGDAIPSAGRDSRELTEEVERWIEAQVIAIRTNPDAQPVTG